MAKERESMNIGDVITDSFKEFKENFKTYLKIIILLSFIPMIIFTVIQIFWMKDIIGLGENADPMVIVSSFFGPWFFVGALFFIIVMVLGIWMQSSLINYALNKKKSTDVKEILNSGKKYFWRFFGLNLFIFLIFILPILILSGIIGISAYFTTVSGQNNSWAIFAIVLSVIALLVDFIVIIYLSVKWSFSPFILIGENKKVIESIRGSRSMVKKRWWMTFLYLVLILLLIWVVSFVITIPSMIINRGINLTYYGTEMMSDSSNISAFSGNFNIFVITLIVSTIFSLIAQAIVIPLAIFLFKNFYLMRKEEMKK